MSYDKIRVNNKLGLTFLVVFLSLGISACESVDSDDIRTSGVYAYMNVEAKGDGNTRVSARLTVGGAFSNTDLELVLFDTEDTRINVAFNRPSGISASRYDEVQINIVP